jgi:hypothetical protein
MTVAFNGVGAAYDYQCQRVAGQQGGRTLYADSAPRPDQLAGAQNAQICTVSILITIKAELIQAGTRAVIRALADRSAVPVCPNR